MFSLKEVSFLSYFCIFVNIKYAHMILIIDPKTTKLTYYRSLIHACKWNKELKYSTLKNKSLSLNGIVYKGMWMYRINHSRL